jgi:hypothetical protein
MSKQRTIIKAASELPPKQARRVAGAIAAAEAETPDAGTDELLEAAAEAMQRAVEAELVPFIEQSAEKLADSTNDK